jgi:integrase
MPRIKISRSVVEKLQHPENGQVIYYDTSCIGFGVRVTRTAKVYIAEGRVDGRTLRVRIASFGQITPEAARMRAQEILLGMKKGVNISSKSKGEDITLRQIFSEFMEARSKSLKERTVRDYRRSMEKGFKEWHNRRLVDINRKMILKQHARLGREQGESQANQHMAMLSSVYTFCSEVYENEKGEPLLSENPVQALSRTKAWFPRKRRKRVIRGHELATWYEAVMELSNTTVRDFLLFLLFTGLRRGEASRLEWEQVDMTAKTFRIVDTKNRKPLDLPMSSFAYKLLERRKKEVGSNPFVFPGNGRTGYIHDPQKPIRKIVDRTGIQFSSHDLRRTFITIAGQLVTAYELKALVNHSSTDVTQGYLIFDVENLRKPMQRITDYMLRLCQAGDSKIIQFPSVGV